MLRHLRPERFSVTCYAPWGKLIGWIAEKDRYCPLSKIECKVSVWHDGYSSFGEKAATCPACMNDRTVWLADMRWWTPKYRYVWGNNAKRRTMKGRLCRILATGKKNTVMIEFDNGQREAVSRRALRRAK